MKVLDYGAERKWQGLSALSVPLLPKPRHLQGVIEVDVLHQLLTGRAGRIRSTRCSAPPAPMATCRM
ncbi:TPA: hypothetical protein VDV13_003513 [Pseudomonas aeruginosa]|nr:hypothetical protein [Pseudomonas aeruginosa]HEP9124166.1 hypothetical protein [Pseudomonas aeruginosa]HEP9136815.1 hypothetical protein [Pseudomonas aeruginosa]HEP9142771.1 hypothetical protein [Pseudomonas aeruginosa]HEP9149155.1 hypothetical protein [Pseudomonas aeruginosa]